MALVNIALGCIMATSIGLIAHESSNCGPKSVTQSLEPYSPALKAVIPVIKKFKAEPKFHSEELEAAWDRLLGPNNGIVALNEEEISRLSKTSHGPIHSEPEPFKHLYVISMYQQLHCLNTVRKSLQREDFLGDLSDEVFQHQTNQCLDFLRQAIQCHGDVSMLHLSDQANSGSDTSPFVNPHSVARFGKASVSWDVEHSCRALAPIEQWVAEHQPGKDVELDV
ncbi:Oxidase ustYa [Hyphodiscus hymeniophilus]|uniref:Oxidase ustYa n=1 Tax=Hyphodiscus hymeniophilus TaxID=353542 RepID=A0A9P6VSR3_9HELO|nr:Oxidase ustYa [Hyphodiscus hymeniophilus]